MPKSAIEKLTAAKAIRVVKKLPAGVPWAPPGVSMVVATPLLVYELMRRIPSGRLMTIAEVRAYFARKYKTTVACPVSTGIFISICAAASAEYEASGRSADAVAYWRVLKADGLLNDKYPGGFAGQEKRLKSEGFSVIRKTAKKWQVENYPQFLWHG